MTCQLTKYIVFSHCPTKNMHPTKRKKSFQIQGHERIWSWPRVVAGRIMFLQNFFFPDIDDKGIGNQSQR
jgi:hypothetical protein